jgi:Fe2+ or Zn2+ uptake regulation protein
LSVKTWKPHPLYTAVVEILERKGPLNDAELFDLVKQDYEEIGFADLNKTLLKLEVEGSIYVSTLTKGKRRVELKKSREEQ